VTGGRLNVLNAIRRLDPTFNVSLPATASFSGPVGGLFAPATITYVISNQASNTISWTASKTAAWLDLSLTNATLAPGQSTNVVVAWNTNAIPLPFGTYTDTITFSNLTSSATRLRSVQLRACTGGAFRQVAAGDNHTVVVKRDGSLWAWGFNIYGQLGDGTWANKSSPVQIGTDTNGQSVTAGSGHTLALKTDGTLWAWGYNYFGQLGDGTVYNSKNSPVQVGTATNWQSVVAGAYQTLALKTDGTLWAWGFNTYGQLGDGTAVNKSSPVQIGTTTNWQSVAAGYGHTVAIKNDGTLWAWGWNPYGQLGDGTTGSESSPEQIGTTTNWLSVTAGYYHTVALKNDGTLWAWGDNSSGQLGDGSQVNKSSPVQIGTATNWLFVEAGFAHTMAIKRDGTLWAWGYNSYGQLGDGTTGVPNSKYSPVQIGTATNWQSVVAGYSHTAALKNDGTLWTWGRNNYGQLGNGNTNNSSSPTNLGLAAFLTQPQNVVASAGTIVTFMATAASTTPLSYQWQFNGLNLTDSARISGAQTHSLTLWGMLPTDVGNYQLVIANTYGAITSSVATLTMTVSPTPVITSQPQSLTNLAGTTASFVVTASGTPPLGYQWQFNGTNLTDTLRVAGSQSAFLNITNLLAADAGNYQVIVTNSAGSVTSSVASLTVVLPPQFQPVLATGGNLQFAWNALPGRTYQLQYKSDLLQTNWSALGSPITAVGGAVSTSDAMTNSQRFYRVILLP
jgi:alpha-tubulin suppressor-like RCC1 family protein